MRKITALLLSVFLTFFMCIGLVGCVDKLLGIQDTPEEYRIVWVDGYGQKHEMDFAQEEGKTSYRIDCNLEYVARIDGVLNFTLEGLYHKDGKAVGTELYQEISAFGNIPLESVGHRILIIPCEFYYFKDGTKYVDYTIDFHFSVRVTENKLFHQYVTMQDVEVPLEYFDCEMQTISADTYNLSEFQDMLGVGKNSYDYECGTISTNASGYISENFLMQCKNQNGTVYYTAKRSLDGYYQYFQLKGPKDVEEIEGYILTEERGLFGAKKTSMLTDLGVEENLPYHFVAENDFTETQYKAGEKDGYLYLSIWGEKGNNSVSITYKIQDKTIVAWLYEKTVSKNGVIFSTDKAYMIPLSGEMELLDEAILEEFADLY